MKTIGIIRDRGQLTIPDNIRKTAKWANSTRAVSITLIEPDEIVIRPEQTNIDWQDIWAGIKRARSIRGRTEAASAAEFLRTDRKSH